MDKWNLNIYSVKDIMLGYVTTVNPDSYTLEDQLIKTVIALKSQKVNKNEVRLVPIMSYYPYYSIDKVVPISTKMNKKSKYISIKDIDLIIEKEKKKINAEKVSLSIDSTAEIDKPSSNMKYIVNEIDIEKTKRLVA